MAPWRASTTKSEWLPDDPTAFVPTRLWKLPCITTWDDSRNQNQPTDSAEEAFFQGLVPALIARELFLRHKVIRRGAWMAAVIVLVCLGISAIYELFEWRTAVFSGSAADAFLGTQGDPWDTQEDMFTAGIGASAALLLLSRVHDAALLRLIFN